MDFVFDNGITFHVYEVDEYGCVVDDEFIFGNGKRFHYRETDAHGLIMESSPSQPLSAEEIVNIMAGSTGEWNIFTKNLT